jgi:hypothetical protein
LSDVGGEEALLAAEVVLRGQLHTPPHITPSHHHTLAYPHTRRVYLSRRGCESDLSISEEFVVPRGELFLGRGVEWAWLPHRCMHPLIQHKGALRGVLHITTTTAHHNIALRHSTYPPSPYIRLPLCGRTMVCLSSLCLARICSYSDSPVMAGGWCGAVAVRAWKRRCTSAAAA